MKNGGEQQFSNVIYFDYIYLVELNLELNHNGDELLYHLISVLTFTKHSFAPTLVRSAIIITSSSLCQTVCSLCRYIYYLVECFACFQTLLIIIGQYGKLPYTIGWIIYNMHYLINKLSSLICSTCQLANHLALVIHWFIFMLDIIPYLHFRGSRTWPSLYLLRFIKTEHALRTALYVSSRSEFACRKRYIVYHYLFRWPLMLLTNNAVLFMNAQYTLFLTSISTVCN